MVSGLGAKLLDGVLRSPLYPLLLVPQARRTMVRTAQANGIDWPGARAWIAEQSWEEVSLEDLALSPPEYYCRPFHAYEAGNLCWEAAWEQELASKAVGARNFPAYRAEGEEAFRGAFEAALGDLGAQVPQGAILVDMGCGTGGSTRRLAEKHPHAQKVIGFDLSPYMISVGQRLLTSAPLDSPPWVSPIRADARCELRLADIARTGLPDASADVVCLTLVAHELPQSAFREVAAEAHRLLRPGGQLWISEMDFETPGYKKLRGNPALYSLIRATEPYLDEYAEYQLSGELAADLVRQGFAPVKLAAATGRHFAAIATKPAVPIGEAELDAIKRGAAAMADAGLIVDRRAETAKDDTHLLTWEARASEIDDTDGARSD